MVTRESRNPWGIHLSHCARGAHVSSGRTKQSVVTCQALRWRPGTSHASADLITHTGVTLVGCTAAQSVSRPTVARVPAEQVSPVVQNRSHHRMARPSLAGCASHESVVSLHDADIALIGNGTTAIDGGSPVTQFPEEHVCARCCRTEPSLHASTVAHRLRLTGVGGFVAHAGITLIAGVRCNRWTNRLHTRPPAQVSPVGAEQHRRYKRHLRSPPVRFARIRSFHYIRRCYTDRRRRCSPSPSRRRTTPAVQVSPVGAELHHRYRRDPSLMRTAIRTRSEVYVTHDAMLH